jgi:hypothetical protein
MDLAQHPVQMAGFNIGHVKPHPSASTELVSKVESVLLIGCGNSNILSALDENQAFIYSDVKAAQRRHTKTVYFQVDCTFSLL